MIGKKVYVVQNLELGFDNVVAIISSDDVDIEDVVKEYIEDNYYIEEHVIQEFGVY